MDTKIREKFGKFGNIYEILQIPANSSKNEIKRAYKKLVLIYHPDKQTGDDDKFMKVQHSYEILRNKKMKMLYDEFLTLKVANQNRIHKNNSQRGKYYEDLIKREENFEIYKKEQKQKFYEQKQKEKQKQMRKTKKEQEEKNVEKIRKETKKLRDNSIEKTLSQIKISWAVENQVTYPPEILKMIYEQFGPVRKVELKENKSNQAILEFWKHQSAQKAYDDYKQKKKEGFNDGLSVRLVLKKDVRKKAIELMKQAPVDTMTLNSQTLTRISNMMNRDSKVYIQTDRHSDKRDQNRKAYMKQMMQDELKKADLFKK